MSDTSNIFENIKGFKIPPIDQWHPDNIVDFDIHIDRHGNWYHEGGVMKRRRLVKLFASVMRREDDGHYYLVTPPTKYRICVDDVPLIIVQMHVEHEGTAAQNVYFRTNMDDEICLSVQHPMQACDFTDDHGGSLKLPYIYVRQGITARLSRNVFFEFADKLKQKSEHEFCINSAGETFKFIL